MIPVLEIFGPTIQGEGAVIGKKTMFVRTAGCDFRCSWCDSSFTWDGSQKHLIQRMTAEEVYNELNKLAPNNFNHVTISGGNPALIKSLDSLVRLLKNQHIEIAVETQGTVFHSWLNQVDDLTISPKPRSSGMNQSLEQLDQFIDSTKAVKRRSLKVVVFDEDDIEDALIYHKRYPDIPFYIQVGNPFLNESVENHRDYLLSRYEWLIDLVMNDERFLNVHILPQLHTILWSNKQKV